MDIIYGSKWITSPFDTESKVWKYSKEFNIAEKVLSAHIYCSAIGVYTAKINGKKLDIYPFAPGWTLYTKRVQYQKSDISSILTVGENKIEISVGRGFLCQDLFHEKNPKECLSGLKPDCTAAICAVELTFTDGRKEYIFTDGSWSVCETKNRYADMYGGDVYDATFSAADVYFARQLPASTDMLIPQEGEIIAEHEVLDVKELIKTPAGETVLDFGQEITGYVEFNVTGNNGGRCSFSHGEMLDKNGNFYNENYRSAKAETVFICDGTPQSFKPEYNYYGFRYIKINEWAEEIKPENFRAIAVYSDMKRRGRFECSDERLNKLYQNIIWGQRGNFLDVPTDCPQRDERIGWTGDAEVFSNCAAINYDARKFFDKWLADMRLCQTDDGRIPVVVPSHWVRSSAAWSDACVIIPYNLYMQYGDKKIIYDNYDMMRRWIEYMRDNFDDYTSEERFHYGDWLAMERPDRYTGLTPKEFVATAYAAYSTELFISLSEAIGKDIKEYEEFLGVCLDKVKREFSDEDEYEKVHSGEKSLKTQTYYALMLEFGLCDGTERNKLAEKLVNSVKANGCRLTTGFVGTPHLLYALSRNGYEKEAFSVLLGDKCPSWLYSIKQGATTIWEHWDGVKENGDMWDKKMNSFNHYAYGAVGEWMYSVMAGITPAEAGYKTVLFCPKTDERINYVKASIDTEYGKISSEWKRENGKTEYIFTVPKNVKAMATIDNKTIALKAGENRIVR